jgi:hypothetical protein
MEQTSIFSSLFGASTVNKVISLLKWSRSDIFVQVGLAAEDTGEDGSGVAQVGIFFYYFFF